MVVAKPAWHEGAWRFRAGLSHPIDSATKNCLTTKLSFGANGAPSALQFGGGEGRICFSIVPYKAVFGHGENLGGGLHLCNDHQHLGCGCLHHVSGVDETKASISAVILTGKLSFLVQPQAKRTDFPLFVSCGELLCPTLRVILHILRPDLGLFSRLSKMEQTRDQETRNKRECLSVVALRGGVVPPL